MKLLKNIGLLSAATFLLSSCGSSITISDEPPFFDNCQDLADAANANFEKEFEEGKTQYKLTISPLSGSKGDFKPFVLYKQFTDGYRYTALCSNFGTYKEGRTRSLACSGTNLEYTRYYDEDGVFDPPAVWSAGAFLGTPVSMGQSKEGKFIMGSTEQCIPM